MSDANNDSVPAVDNTGKLPTTAESTTVVQPAVTTLEKAVEWNAKWADGLLKAANSFIVERNWLVGTDRYNGVNGLPELETINLDLPTNGVKFLNFYDETGKFADETWPQKMQDMVPEFAAPLTTKAELQKLKDLIAPFERFADVVPTLDPTDPGLDTLAAIVWEELKGVEPDLPEHEDVVALTAVPPDESSVPEIKDPILPDPPNLDDLPVVPDFELLSLPGAPDIANIPYDPEPPQNLLTPPSERFSYVDAGYTSALRDPLIAKLLDNLTNGGYGIETNDEQQLWNRARDREAQAGVVRVAEVKRQAASMSFPMPQGSLYKQLADAAKDVLEKAASLNREMTLKRGDLYVENRKFTIQEVQSYEKIARDLYNAVQERALNMSKATVELALARFDSEVKNFNTRLDQYKAGALVFETRVKAELAKLEVFKAKIEAESLKLGFNKAKVDLYLGQLQGIKAKIELYKTQVEQTEIELHGEELRLRAFEDKVKVYTSQVVAKDAEYNNYAATLRGDEAKLNLYDKQIAVWRANNDEKWREKEQDYKNNDEKLKKYNMEIQNLMNRFEMALKKISLYYDWNKQATSVFEIRAKMYDVLTQQLYEGIRQQQAAHKLNVDQALAANKTQADAVKFTMEKLDKQLQLIDKANARGMDYYRSLLGATLSNVNTLSSRSE